MHETTKRLIREIPTLTEYNDMLKIFGKQEEIAKAFGVNRGTVSRWLLKLKSKERVERRKA